MQTRCSKYIARRSCVAFLKILGHYQEVNKRDGKYVEGAEPGKIINTVTNELYDDIDVIPCHYKRQYVEWQDRGTSTGAPVAIHEQIVIS